MAQSSLTSRKLVVAALTAIGAALLVALLASPLGTIEDRVTGLRYFVRGAQQADTNIAIVYIDDDAVRLTGWPVSRSYTATMISVLKELHARAIGIEVLLEDQRPEYPEYDEFLGSVLRSSGHVVLTSYFDSLVAAGSSTRDTLKDESLLRYTAVSTPVVSGRGYHAPLPLFMGEASGVGHVNFADDMDVPVFIGSGESVVPAFPLELLRVALGVERGSVFYDRRTVSMKKRDADVCFSTAADGQVTLCYPGGIHSFTTYRFVDVLMSYEAAKTVRDGSAPVPRLRDKIVLVGIVAEGRSQMFATPVDPRYPSIGLHATFLDNALHSRFLHALGTPWMALLSMLMGFGCGVAVLFLRPPFSTIIAIGGMVILILASFLLFAKAAFVLPLVGPLGCGVVGTIRAMLYRHRIERDQFNILAKEKDAVIAQLRDKEARLMVLERELVDGASASAADRTNELLEEIRKYKAEIRVLSSQADDMVEYHSATTPPITLEFEGIVYSKGGRMKNAVEFVEKIASSDAPVLILGESGTGKELIAHAIHKRSPRSQGPFVAVNCAALTETLLESELFGHEKGAFTGAVKEKMGRFELADGGTIFLDEIGEVADSFQVKLLRVLQEGELERVGGTRTIHLNVRVVAATNKDVKEQVRLRKFREDLYYRLNVLAVELSPLRERPEDIPLLIEHFLRREGGSLQVSKNMMEALQSYTWPGNIRELESAIRRGAVLARAEKRSLLTVNDLPEEISTVAKENFPIQEQILELLRQKGFSRSSVSETGSSLGGLNRGTIAEYLWGECLKTFVEQQFDLERSIKYISLSTEADVNERVRKKYQEYLHNIAEGVDKNQPWDSVNSALRPKMKNLPQRYHAHLEQTAEAYFRGVWKVQEGGSSIVP